jgi:hypothetical protein
VVRLITRSWVPRARRWMISSLTPSEKNCISGSFDRLSKASTAITGRSRGADGSAGEAGASSSSKGSVNR